MKDKIFYECPESIVTVVRKTEGLRRNPPSKYPVVMFILRPKQWTRVQRISENEIEFAANFDEIRAFLEAIDPALAALLPESAKNKPEWIRKRWQRINQRRARRWWGTRNPGRHNLRKGV
ncbi:MAG: hypothetical protein LV481_02340 [Methylacidiphilales bacterium]|nr:hypothetical protein [Candidatus Methylacidiphilales bacterium]